MSRNSRNCLVALAMIAGLAGCASTADIAGAGPRPADLADCRVGGEPGPRQAHGPTTARDRRCNPERDTVLWSSGGRDDGIKLDMNKRD